MSTLAPSRATSVTSKAGGRAKRSPAPVALAPLAIIIALFFALPVVGMTITSFLVSDPDVPRSSTFGFDYYIALAEGNNRAALANSFAVSAISATVASVLGTICAWAISGLRSGWLDSVTGVISSVLANSGGAPLAFAFIVTAGNTGYLVSMITAVNPNFSLYSVDGLVLMYQYFLIPTMILLTLPTLRSIRQSWRDANTSLGGSSAYFWWRVGLPISAPALLGGWILLFGAAFGTHASAAVLIGSGAFPLVPLAIEGGLRGSVGGGGDGVAMAMGVTMTIIAVVVLVAFNWLQRRSASWLR